MSIAACIVTYQKPRLDKLINKSIKFIFYKTIQDDVKFIPQRNTLDIHDLRFYYKIVLLSVINIYCK